MKQTVEDDKVKDKISADEIKQICDACDEAIKWLDSNQTAEQVILMCFKRNMIALKPVY